MVVCHLEYKIPQKLSGSKNLYSTQKGFADLKYRVLTSFRYLKGICVINSKSTTTLTGSFVLKTELLNRFPAGSYR